MKKYILWDHDGVLVDTEKFFYSATRKALNEIDVDFNMETYLQFMTEGRGLWDLALDAGISTAIIESQKSKRDAYYQHSLLREEIEIEGVAEALSYLAKSYRMAIVTSARRSDFDLIHSDRDLLAGMEFVLTLEDYENCKPAPDPYLAALERFSAKKNEAVVIEDSQRGLNSALNAGIDCVIIENDFTKAQDFSEAKTVLGSIRELADYISSLQDKGN